MRRILHIVASLDPDTGGVAQAVRSLIDGMAELDVTNEVVCLDDSDSGYLKSDPFTVHALGTGKCPWNYNDHLLGEGANRNVIDAGFGNFAQGITGDTA